MKAQTRILLAEDDADFGAILKQYLEMHDFDVQWVRNGADALVAIQKLEPHICVLDVMMPHMDGFSLAERIVERKPELPFVFLTAREQKQDKIKGLRLGADDYIVKPFEAEELVLRLQNILKRSQYKTSAAHKATYVLGSYRFESQSCWLRHPNGDIRLTQKESSLLQYLVLHKNQLLKREAILQAVWQKDDFFSGRSMDVFISRLRKYLKHDADIQLRSIRNVGLEFVLHNEA
ncbi:MAG: response regulator transcription factor [Flavobacteriaceae bacterium]|nr:response regulator transcription factor [Flavobacteriaceae bacterium]